ncbi:MAG: hypothetical protein R3A52_18855 [Polyangiales bacterium]
MNPSKRWLWAALALVGACDLLDRRRAQDEQCLFNGDCEDPLVCAGRRCRAPCRTDRDCSGGWTCRPSGQTDRRVCLPPGDFGYCAYSADCDRPAVCQRNGVCGVQCRRDYDCQIYSAGSECRRTDHDPPLFLCTTNPDYTPVEDAGAPPDANLDAGDAMAFPDAPPVTDAPDASAPDASATPDAPDATTAPDAGIDAGGGDGGDAAVPTDTGGMYPCPYTTEPGVCTPGAPGCDIIDFSAGKDSVDVACAAFSDGHVRCWGWNLAGSFGNGSTLPQHCGRPSVVPGLRGVRALSTGNAFVCALTDTQVLCWGSNFQGNLGLGLMTGGRRSPTPQPTTLSSGSSYRLFTGMTNGCVIESGMFRVCWGANNQGQLGDGTTINREARATILMGGAPDAVALGETHSCLHYFDGSVLCMGDNTYGQLGNGAAGGSTSTPTLVASLSDVAEVGAGRYFTCARTNAGAVLCWGNNTGAELGNGSRGGRNPTPSPVLGLPGPVAEIAVGQLSSCARLQGSGEVYCWGSQSLGDPMSSSVAMTARRVPGLTGVRRLSGGSGFCAFLGGADLRCWGPSAGSGGMPPPILAAPTAVAW